MSTSRSQSPVSPSQDVDMDPPSSDEDTEQVAGTAQGSNPLSRSESQEADSASQSGSAKEEEEEEEEQETDGSDENKGSEESEEELPRPVRRRKLVKKTAAKGLVEVESEYKAGSKHKEEAEMDSEEEEEERQKQDAFQQDMSSDEEDGAQAQLDQETAAKEDKAPESEQYRQAIGNLSRSGAHKTSKAAAKGAKQGSQLKHSTQTMITEHVTMATAARKDLEYLVEANNREQERMFSQVETYAAPSEAQQSSDEEKDEPRSHKAACEELRARRRLKNLQLEEASAAANQDSEPMCILSDADLNSIADKQRENRRAQREADAQVGGQDSQGDYDMFGLDVQPPFNQALLDMPHWCQTIGGNVPVFQLSSAQPVQCKPLIVRLAWPDACSQATYLRAQSTQQSTHVPTDKAALQQFGPLKFSLPTMCPQWQHGVAALNSFSQFHDQANPQLNEDIAHVLGAGTFALSRCVWIKANGEGGGTTPFNLKWEAACDSAQKFLRNNSKPCDNSTGSYYSLPPNNKIKWKFWSLSIEPDRTKPQFSVTNPPQDVNECRTFILQQIIWALQNASDKFTHVLGNRCMITFHTD